MYSKDESGARADFEKAMALAPQNDIYPYELGRLHYRVEKPDLALPLLEKAMKLAPEKPGAHYTAGLVHIEAGRQNKGVELLEKVVELDPEHADAHYNLGLHHQLHGDAKKQLEHYAASLALTPQRTDAIAKVIQSHYRLGQYDQAGPLRDTLLELAKKAGKPAEFCFHQFDAPGGGRFFAYETVDKAKDGVVNWYRFKLVKDDKIEKSINVETSEYAKERGTPFILGEQRGATHSTYPVGWKELPPYPDIETVVLKVHRGEIKAQASSRPQ